MAGAGVISMTLAGECNCRRVPADYSIEKHGVFPGLFSAAFAIAFRLLRRE